MLGIALALALGLGFLLHDVGAGWDIALLIGLAAAAIIMVRRDVRTITLVAIAGSLLLLGAWRAAPDRLDPSLTVIAEATSEFRGQVLDVPSRYPENTLARVRLSQPVDFVVSAVLPPYPLVNQGDIIQVQGSWSPHDKGIDGVSSRGASGRLVARSASVVQSDTGPIQRFRVRTTSFVERTVLRYVPEPAGALVLGVLTGNDRGMTSATRETFREAGLTHLTAVSGWNVALVTAFVALLTSRTPLALTGRIVISVLSVWVYAFLVGMEPSVQRAAVMATMYLVARWIGRPSDIVTALAWAVVLILLVDPEMRFDVGFQLSAVATLALALIVPVLDGRPIWQIAIAIPLIAELAVAPIILYHFGTYSIASPVANVLVSPLIGVVMLGGVLILIGSLIHPWLAEAAGIVAWVPASLTMRIAEMSTSIEWGIGRSAPLGWSGVVISYILLFGAYILAIGRQDPRWQRFVRQELTTSPDTPFDRGEHPQYP